MARFHLKRLVAAFLATMILYLYYLHRNRNDFYNRTVKALEKQAADQAWKAETDAQVSLILEHKEAGRTGPVPFVSGAPTTSVSPPRLAPLHQAEPPFPGKDRPRYPTRSSTIATLTTSPALTPSLPLSPAAKFLDALLAQHLILIFSKSYCPFSARAKTILLETYAINPVPHVVDLDLLTDLSASTEQGGSMGQALQNLLAEKTGRTTVPNVLVGGVSLGGGDEMSALDETGRVCGKLGEALEGKGSLQSCKKTVT